MRDACSYGRSLFAAVPLFVAVLFLFLAGFLLVPTPATAQQGNSEASADSYEWGKTLWIQKSCVGCHTIGEGRMAGPDLEGVTERRQEEWLRNFMAETDEMLDSDPLAQRMLELYNYQRMPQVELRDEEITALLHYIQEKSSRTPSDGQE